MEPLAVKKYENFEQLRCLYPEFRCVFIGDNGQGELNVFQRLSMVTNVFLRTQDGTYFVVYVQLERSAAVVHPCTTVIVKQFRRLYRVCCNVLSLYCCDSSLVMAC
jgi:hypothetical protein